MRNRGYFGLQCRAARGKFVSTTLNLHRKLTMDAQAFTPGLERFEEYVRSATPSTVNGRTIIDLLDNFAAILQIHLTDEVVWILSLSKYPNLDLASIDVQHGNFVRAHSSKTTLLPYLLTNHDLTYEGGIHDWWPSDSKVRLFFLRYICTIWNHGAWRYSSCSKSGKPKPLYGLHHRLGSEHSLAIISPQPAMVELLPERPQPAYTERPRSKESEEFAGAKHSRGRGDNASSSTSVGEGSSATTPRNSVGRLVLDDEKRGVGYSVAVLPPPVTHPAHHGHHGHHHGNVR